MKRKVIAVLLAFMLVSFSALAVFTAADMGRVWRTATACSIDLLTIQDLSLLTVLYPDLEWTAYTQSTPLTIANDELPTRTVEAAVLSFLGTPEQIAFFPLVSGRLPLKGELGSCALDVNTSFELFKSTNAGGNLIRLDGKRVRVVGVVDVDRSLVLTPAEQDTKLNRLVADNREAMLSLSSALVGADPDSFELNGAELTKLMWFLCAVPWLVVTALFLGSLRKRGGWWRVASTISLWALFMCAVLVLLWCVPVRLLPARWSDMEFYGEQVAAYRTRAYRAPDIRDELLKSDMQRAVLWCAMACIALWMERMWLRCVKSH